MRTRADACIEHAGVEKGKARYPTLSTIRQAYGKSRLIGGQQATVNLL